MNPLNDILQLLEQFSQTVGVQALQASGISLTEKGADPKALAAQVDKLFQEGMLHQQPTWAAHMTTTVSSQSLFGQILSTLHNGNLLSPELYPVLASIEQQMIDWFCQLFSQQHGHFTAGSSYGNLEALWQAKQANLKTRIVYASRAAHYSINKACQLLELDLRLISTDDNDQIDIASLKTACLDAPPMVIVATAGTPSAGSFDAIDDCLLIAQQHQTWCHIDAAWGGSLRLLPECQSLFGQHFAKADSICFDPHKAWGQPKPASILLYQRPMPPMMFIEPDYLQQSPATGLAGSRGGEAFLPLWYTVAALGSEALQQHCREPLKQAKQFAQQLAENTAWPTYLSPSGIVCFETNQDLSRLVALGMLSQARRADRAVYRVVFTSPLVRADALITQLQPYF